MSKKKKIFLIILSSLFLVVVVLSIYSLVRKLIINKNDTNISSSINELKSSKEDYVFVEINPKLLLVVQDDKISNIYCMNHDCANFYNDIHVKNMKIIDGVNQIYNVAREKGFDTTNGVKIKSTTYIPIENYNYDFIEVEYIKEEQKNQLLTEVQDYKDNIEQTTEEYYDNLLDKLKQDNDYDKFYSCKKENDSLGCYFIMDSIKVGFDLESFDITDWNSLFSNKSDVLRILKKFNFNVDKDLVRINNTNFTYSVSFTHNNTKYGNILYHEMTEKLSDELCAYISDNNCYLTTGIEFIKLSDINLLEPIITSDKLIKISNGIKEHLVENYNFEHSLDIDNAEEKEKIKNECITKGYHLENKTYCDDGNCVEQEMWCRQESNGVFLCRNSCEDID